MSFATRCTSCGTIFRVVVDQLKVSEGWVRCGRCHAVFNAEQGLFDLEHDAPPAWDEPAAADDTPATEATEENFSSHEQSVPDPSDESEPPLGIGAAARASLESTPAFDDDTTRSPSDHQGAAFDMAATRFEGAFTARQPDDGPELLEPMTDSANAPGFVLQAQRNERWRSTPVRLMLGLLSLLLVGGVAAGAWWFGWERYTTTPGVLGLDEAAATVELEDAGLRAEAGEPAYSENVTAGLDIVQKSVEPNLGGSFEQNAGFLF